MRRTSASICVAALAVGDQPRADGAVDVAHEILDAVAADREAEVLRRDVLELVRLVDDRVCCSAGMTSPNVALPDGRVGAQQVVVDDDDVGFGRALAHLVTKQSS